MLKLGFGNIFADKDITNYKRSTKYMEYQEDIHRKFLKKIGIYDKHVAHAIQVTKSLKEAEMS